MAEPHVAESYWYKLDQELRAVNIVSFADDIAKGKYYILILYDKIVSQFQKLGLKLQKLKSLNFKRYAVSRKF